MARRWKAIEEAEEEEIYILKINFILIENVKQKELCKKFYGKNK